MALVTSSSTKMSSSSASHGGLLGDELDGGSSQSLHKYQVYRGISPTTSHRLEVRIRELEDALEAERDTRMRCERESTELSFQMEGLSERLDEADGLSSAQGSIARKREQEATKYKKDLELLQVQFESQEASLRKKHTDALNDLADQLEHASRGKAKSEKEKQQLIIEIDAVSSQCDAANNARSHAETKVEGMEDQLRRLKAQVDELTRQNHDLNGLKARLTQENFELQRQLQELESGSGGLAKQKAALQAALDDAKSRLDDETRERSALTITVNNLNIELDNMAARLDEESDAAGLLRNQNGKLNTDLANLKSRYDKDVLAKAEEFEALRRKFLARIAELEDLAEQGRLRASKFEKERNKLNVEIRELTIELEGANANLGDLSKRVKHAEGLVGDLQRRLDEATHDLQNANGENSKLNAELMRLRAQLSDLSDKNDQLTRDNKQLSDALREAQGENKDLARQTNELLAIRVALEGERDGLAIDLGDTRDALSDAQARLDAATSALNQLRSDLEARLHEKDNEIDNLRKSGARALDELQRTIMEIETRYKAELGRLKKKYETEIREYEIQIETLARTNAELGKNNKSLASRLKEIEIALDDERRGGDEARQAVTVLERKRIALTTELEDLRSLLETSERARKNAENEMAESGGRINELSITVTALSGDKRRMEADIGAMQADLDEALNGRRASDDRADRLQAELNRLMEELRQEQENYKNAEGLRKSLEVEMREITVRLEEAEAFAQREGKRLLSKLQNRVRDLEAELEAEQRRARDLAAANHKLERALAEIRVQAEDDHRLVREYSESINVFTLKIKTLRRQLEEAEEVVTITMNKYRKAQSMMEEADHRADMAERNIQAARGRGGRSMSVTREVCRVVRV